MGLSSPSRVNGGTNYTRYISVFFTANGVIICYLPPTLYKNLQHLGVSKNNGTPKSSILIGFSIIIINHPFWVVSLYFWFNTHLLMARVWIPHLCQQKKPGFGAPLGDSSGAPENGNGGIFLLPSHQVITWIFRWFLYGLCDGRSPFGRRLFTFSKHLIFTYMKTIKMNYSL